jgi:catechol 2,3-dioxygenase-like lactoylglutathione lyase family enzyme
MLTIHAVDHVVLNVLNVDESAAWYERVLRMAREASEATSGSAARTSMMFGRNKINLRPITATQAEWFTANAPQPGSLDLCLLTNAGPDQVTDHFLRCGVEIALGPVNRRGAMGEIRSVYVRDPDGNLIEVSSYC